MSGTGQTAAAAQLSGYFNGTTITLPSALWFGLFTTASTSTTLGTELTYTGYARISVTNSTANFTVAPNPSSPPPQVSNASPITWGTVTGNVNNQPVVQVCIFATSGATQPLYYLDIPSGYQKAFGLNDQPSFAVGTLTVAIN